MNLWRVTHWPWSFLPGRCTESLKVGGFARLGQQLLQELQKCRISCLWNPTGCYGRAEACAEARRRHFKAKEDSQVLEVKVKDWRLKGIYMVFTLVLSFFYEAEVVEKQRLTCLRAALCHRIGRGHQGAVLCKTCVACRCSGLSRAMARWNERLCFWPGGARKQQDTTQQGLVLVDLLCFVVENTCFIRPACKCDESGGRGDVVNEL